LGPDELMIVNPSSRDSEMVFLGDDGTLYRIEGIERATANHQGGSLTAHPGDVQERAVGRFFLGEDGTLYEVIE
jgi:hypothetical protein